MWKYFLILPVLFVLGALSAAEPKIVSLSPALTELLCQLGKEKNLVGRSSVCNYPESVRKLPVAGDFAKPYLETILSLKPTHLFTNDLINPNIARTFHSAGIQVIRKQCRTPEEYMEWVTLAGKILNCSEKAGKENARIRQELAELKRKADAIPPGQKKQVVWVIWDAPLMIAGQGSLPDRVIEWAGLRNQAGNIKTEYFKASFEWLLKQQPEILIMPDFSEQKIAELKTKFPWKELRAVQKNQIIADLDPDLLLRPGPRLTEGIRQLAERCAR